MSTLRPDRTTSFERWRTTTSGHLYTVLFLLAAMVLYAAGAILPATGLIVLGILAEMTFWVRLFRGRRRRRKT